MKPASSLILPPLSGIFSLLTRMRLAGYRRGLFSSSSLPVPVISIGNITTGGTGKTPLVDWVSRIIGDLDKRVCVLTRGYGRTNPSAQVIVSNAQKILVTERDAGDEPFLLASNLLGVAAVVCNRDRKAAGEWAIQNLGSEVFVLDDGFQHFELKRDLNIVTIDATNPWGGSPANGILREPVSGLERADCVVITRTDQVDNLTGLILKTQELAGDSPIFRSRMVTSRLRGIAGETVDSGLLKTEPVAAFCGIGNPTSFFDHLKRDGYELDFTSVYKDHHHYTQNDVNRLVANAQERGIGSLITTAKDATKLSSLELPLSCYVLEIEIAIEGEERLAQIIRNAIESQTT